MGTGAIVLVRGTPNMTDPAVVGIGMAHDCFLTAQDDSLLPVHTLRPWRKSKKSNRVGCGTFGGLTLRAVRQRCVPT